MYQRAEQLAGPAAVDDLHAAAALVAARRRLRDADSFRFWFSIAGRGPAGAGLNDGEPLILAGTYVAGLAPAAVWSVTSPPSYLGRTIQYTVLDGTVWCDSGVRYWTVFEGSDAELVLGDLAALAPEQSFGYTFLDEGVDLIPAGLDHVGELDAVRFEVADLSTVTPTGWWAGMNGSIERMAVWITDDGVPVQAELAGTINDGSEQGTFRLLQQLAGVDDPANVVEPLA
jgi:hypothetical protein